MPQNEPTRRFLLCLNNEGYPSSLEVRKVYQTLADSAAESRGFVRVIDESGEDYLYPEAFFVAVDLPDSVAKGLVGSV